MNRTDREPEQQFTERLQYYRTTINDMRQAQSFGASDIRLYRLARADSFPDITLHNLTSTTSQGIQITVTPNGGNPVSVPTPVLDIGFSASPSPYGLVSYYSLTRCPPGADGSQRFYYYTLAQSTTITSLSIYLNFWTFVPASYTVSQL